MKNLLKRSLVLVMALVLFAAPSLADVTVTAAARPTPVCIQRDPDFKAWEFQPNPYELSANSALFLKDTTNTDGYYLVPAGKEATFISWYDEPTTVRMRIMKQNGGIVADEILYDIGSTIVIPAQAKDAKYYISVTAYANNVAISEYWMMYE